MSDDSTLDQLNAWLSDRSPWDEDVMSDLWAQMMAGDEWDVFSVTGDTRITSQKKLRAFIWIVENYDDFGPWIIYSMLRQSAKPEFLRPLIEVINRRCKVIEESDHLRNKSVLMRLLEFGGQVDFCWAFKIYATHENRKLRFLARDYLEHYGCHLPAQLPSFE
jgi:hypothetical protein